MRKATENDTDLLAEVQSFWVEPAFCVPAQVLNDGIISVIAVAVLRWLEVRPISLSPTSTSNQFSTTVFLIVRSFMTHPRKRYRFGKPML